MIPYAFYIKNSIMFKSYQQSLLVVREAMNTNRVGSYFDNNVNNQIFAVDNILHQAFTKKD